MTDGQRCAITVHEFAQMLVLEHQLTMEPEAQIHSFSVPKIQNFLPELNILHHLLRATLTPCIGDATTCPQYERNLIQCYAFLSL
jgi:hypothetical protein